jgi:hypothetical protein
MDVADATNHYEEAIFNGMRAGLARKFPPNSRGWIYGKDECRGTTGQASGLDCDEYPFASTEQGGGSNYRGGAGVSLKPVRADHNQAAGRMLGRFYAACDISKNTGSDDKWFGVVALPSAPTTFWKCDNRR